MLEVKESPLEMVCWRSKKGSGIGLLEVKEGLWNCFAGGQRRPLEMACLRSKMGSGNGLMEVKGQALEMVCWMSKKSSGNGLLVDKEGI